MNANTKGTCYLLHFEKPYKHARHYLGWTNDIESRMNAHLEGTGARLLEVITENGIGFSLVRTWPDTTLKDERKLKSMKKNVKLCPLCTPRERKTA